MLHFEIRSRHTRTFTHKFPQQTYTAITQPFAAPLPPTFLIAFMQQDGEVYQRFLRRNPAAIDLDLANELHPAATTPHHQTFYYDGPTHLSYTRPSRIWETWYCATPPGKYLKSCTTFLPDLKNAKKHTPRTVVKKDPVKGRSLFAVDDIPAGNFVGSEDAVWNMHLDRIEWQALNEFVDMFPDAKMYAQLRDLFLVR